MSSPVAPRSRNRAEIPAEYTWNLADIYSGWEAWEAEREVFEQRIAEYAALKGTLAQGAGQLRKAFQLNDAMGQLAHRVYFYPSLRYDEDQRDNSINAKKQQVESLFARWQQATSWLSPELLTIPLETVRTWLDQDADLALYRFAIEEIFRQQEHVLDEPGERLLSLAARVTNAPNEAYWALSTSDAKFPEITLSTGETQTMSYGQYRAVLATNSRALRHVRREPQHVRVAVSLRVPARLVPGARTRLFKLA
jgi:oligoendopeptidase F